MIAQRNSVAVYSSVVRILKIALPLVAVALLSTIFLVQEEDSFDGGLVFSSADLETLGDGLTVNNPRLAGTTRDGTAYVLTAATAVPDQTGISIVEFTGLNSVMRYSGGNVVELHAANAIAMVNERVLNLKNGINLRTSAGYVASTLSATADLDAGTLITNSPVTANGPAGQIKSGRMVVRTAIDAQGMPTDTPEIIFDQRVKLVFEPKAKQ